MTTREATPLFTPLKVSVPAGPRSQAFDDRQSAGKREIKGVSSISIWEDQVVTGLQVTYTLSSGGEYRAPLHGSKSGKRRVIRLAPDEEIVQLSATGNTDSMSRLTLLSTNPDGKLRLHGPFGMGSTAFKSRGKLVPYRRYEMIVGGSDEQKFSWFGGKVMAFVGHTRNGRLNGLGVLSAPLVEVPEGLSSTSVLAQDYQHRRIGSRGRTKLVPQTAYRSMVTLPRGTAKVQLWAEEQLRVTIAGRPYTLDPKKAVEVTPDALGKIALTVDASDISVPAIKLRTDQMKGPWQWYTLHSDVAVHQKMANWAPDTLYENRSKLGISDKVSKSDCAAVQQAIANVVSLGLPEEGQAAHERRIDPKKMAHPNWVLQSGKGKTRYAPARAAELKKLRQSATKVTRTAVASKIDFDKAVKSVGKGLGDAAKGVEEGASSAAQVIVQTQAVKDVAHTLEKAGGDEVVHEAVQLGKHLGNTGKKLADDLQKGDVLGFARDLGEGSLQLGADVHQLGNQAVVTLINTAGEAVEFVLNRVVELGKLVGKLLETIGAEIMKVIDFLLNLIPWDAIANTQKQLMKALDASLDRFAHLDREQALAGFNGFCDHLHEQGDAAFDTLTRRLGGKVEASPGISSAIGEVGAAAKKANQAVAGVMDKALDVLSAPLELVNWLVSKLLENLPGIGDLLRCLEQGAKEVASLMGELRDGLGDALETLPEALGSSLTNLMDAFSDIARAPRHIVAALLQLVKGLLGASIEVVRKVIGVLVSGLRVLAGSISRLGKLDLFPKIQAKGPASFLADFYNLIIGGKLSVFKLLTFLLAVPITMVHLVCFGRPPELEASARCDAQEDAQTGYVVTSYVCNGAALALDAVLSAEELTRGVRKLVDDQSVDGREPNVEQERAERAADTRALWMEVSSLLCSVLGQYFGNPFGHTLVNLSGSDSVKKVDQGLYFAEWAMLAADALTVFIDHKRSVRADLSSWWVGREGAVLSLLVRCTMLGFHVSQAVKEGQHGKHIPDARWASLFGSSGGVIEACFLTGCRQGNDTAAAICAASNLLFGVTSLGVGIAGDVKGA